MSKSFREDLTGKRFGRLTVLEFVPIEKDVDHTYWKCKCECGNIIVTRADVLKGRMTHSCGCFRKDSFIPHKTFKHALRYTRIYRIFKGMKDRCYNPKSSDYNNYGGRGITICIEWKNDVTAFYNWAMKNGYKDNLTIDRIDVNGNYCPENCRWVDMKTQNRNTRRNIFVEYQGKKMTLAESSQKSRINYRTIKARYRRGDRGERLFRPVKSK